MVDKKFDRTPKGGLSLCLEIIELNAVINDIWGKHVSPLEITHKGKLNFSNIARFPSL